MLKEITNRTKLYPFACCKEVILQEIVLVMLYVKLKCAFHLIFQSCIQHIKPAIPSRTIIKRNHFASTFNKPCRTISRATDMDNMVMKLSHWAHNDPDSFASF